jgi:hypothetical protein
LAGTIGAIQIWKAANTRCSCTASKRVVSFAPTRAPTIAVVATAAAATKSTAPALPKEAHDERPTAATARLLVPTAWCCVIRANAVIIGTITTPPPRPMSPPIMPPARPDPKHAGPTPLGPAAWLARGRVVRRRDMRGTRLSASVVVAPSSAMFCCRQRTALRKLLVVVANRTRQPRLLLTSTEVVFLQVGAPSP